MRGLGFILLALLLAGACGRDVKVTNYAPRPLDMNRTLVSLSELEWDANNHLSSNTLLFLDTPGCPQLTELVWNMRFNEQRDAVQLSHTSDLAKQLLGDEFMAKVAAHDPTSKNAAAPCAAVCLDIGAPRDLAAFPLANKIHKIESYNPSPAPGTASEEEAYRTELDFAQFIAAECQGVEVGFVNWSNRTATVYWLNHHNELTPVGRLEEQGEASIIWRNSVLGHTFIVLADHSDDVLLNVTILHDSFLPVGDAGSKIDTKVTDATLEGEVRDTFEREFERASKVTRRFSSLGFDKGRLPAPLWGSIQTFYYNNRNNKVREEWDVGHKGLYVNWWEVNAFMITMPHNLKRTWQQHLLPLVEQWAGTELELTDIYGMRQYEEGARLLAHVDRETTHAASLIINVAQDSVREPWPLEVYDHAGHLHEVTMEPGDIVYYESAKCMHSRMKPLKGAFYVNLFAHYRPKHHGRGDAEWLTKDTPLSVAPVAVIDATKCKAGASYGKTTCSSGPSTPYLAPAAPLLTSPQSLLDHWKRTSHESMSASSLETLRKAQASQLAQAEQRRVGFASAIYALNTNVSDGGLPILDFDDEYLDEEEDEDGLLFTEGPADQDEEDPDQHNHDRDHDHDQHNDHDDIDFADEEDEEGGHFDHHGEHGDEDEHDLGEGFGGDHDHDHDHDHDAYGGGGGEMGGDPYAEQPFEKETYNPYEMPSEHDYWVIPGEAEGGAGHGGGQFISEEQLREMGYGSPDPDQDQDPYQDEDEGEEL